MIEPGEGASLGDFSSVLIEMAHENVKVSKKMAQTYIKGVSKSDPKSLKQALDSILQFI